MKNKHYILFIFLWCVFSFSKVLAQIKIENITTECWVVHEQNRKARTYTFKNVRCDSINNKRKHRFFKNGTFYATSPHSYLRNTFQKKYGTWFYDPKKLSLTLENKTNKGIYKTVWRISLLSESFFKFTSFKGKLKKVEK